MYPHFLIFFMITVVDTQLPKETLDAQDKLERFVRTQPQENDFLMYNTHVYQMNAGIDRWIVAREYCKAQVVHVNTVTHLCVAGLMIAKNIQGWELDRNKILNDFVG